MIYFVRHGQTYDNAFKPEIFSGHNKVKLTPVGIEQAKQAAEELKDIKFDICFCSPLVRAKQTLKEIKKHHKGLKVVFDKRLRERDYGEITNKSGEACPFNRWDANINIPLKMETIEQIFSRVASFFDEILPKYSNKNILIVAHSGVSRMTHFYFNGKPKDGNYSNFYLKNGEIMKIKN